MVTPELGDPFRRDALRPADPPPRQVPVYGGDALNAEAPVAGVARIAALLLLVLPGRRRPGRRAGHEGLSQPADPLHRSLPARRRHRHRRADRGRTARRGAGAAHHHRQPRRRGRYSRHRHRRQVRARRLHDPVHALVAHDQPETLRQAAVRRRKGLRADQPGGADPADTGGKPVAAGEQYARTDRARQSRTGQAQLCLGRHRIAGAHRG